MRYLLTLASLALACGAEAPSPSETDASTDAPASDGAACLPQHIRIGAECIPALDDACGPRRARCPTGQGCVFVGGGGAPTPSDVRCEPL